MTAQDKALAFTGHRPESFLFGEDEQFLECITLKEMLSSEITQKACKDMAHLIRELHAVQIYSLQKKF